MKKILALLLCASFVCTAAEKTKLQEQFHKENSEVKKFMDNAMTTVDLVGAAGNDWNVTEKQLMLAFDYKLRHTSDLKERLKIIGDFHDLSREVQKIFDTPRENMGSLAGMYIYSHIAELMRRQTAILMLDDQSEKRWKRIAHAPLQIEGKNITLENGKDEFTAKAYGREYNFFIMLFPQDTFTFRNRDFAVIRTDIFFSASGDFSTVYLCELKNGKLKLHTKCKFPLISKWELKNGIFTFYGDKSSDIQKIKL